VPTDIQAHAVYDERQASDARPVHVAFAQALAPAAATTIHNTEAIPAAQPMFSGTVEDLTRVERDKRGKVFAATGRMYHVE
jgi:hypothetical protein